MEENILFQNPVLKEIFSSGKFLFDTPLVISQISFSKKSQVENNILMLGDAAGMITPLCGNGMSMALHSSKMAASCLEKFLENIIDRKQMENDYRQLWKKEFSGRLAMGQILQSFFGSVAVSNLFVTGMKAFPFLAKSIIRKTHGQPF
jgi:flavin-dependent dehydrogenase